MVFIHGGGYQCVVPPVPSPPLFSPVSGGGGGSRWGGSHDHELAAASMSSLADVVLVTLNYRWAPAWPLTHT